MIERLAAGADGLAMVEPAARWRRWLWAKDRTVSRRELARRVRAVYTGLRSKGLRPGAVVLYAVRPGIDSIVLMSALLLAGTNVVALDPGVGEQVFGERLKALMPTWVVAEAVVFAAATRGPFRSVLRRFGVEVPNLHVPGATLVCVGPQWPWVPEAIAYAALVAHQHADGPHDVGLDPRRDVLTVFTSGTTSMPKAVLHSATSLGAAIAIIARHMALTPHDVVYSSQTHQMLASLLAGSVCIVPALQPNAGRFIADVARYRATHVFAVPFEMAAILRTLERRGALLPPKLATIVLGSAPVLPRFLVRLRAICAPQTEIWCAYAMTEMFPAALVESREKLAYDGEGDLVGKPLDEVRAVLANDGELLVQGPHRFSRYLGQAATQLHATGDLARFDDQGRIVLLGRKKDMIIRGHYNIYPSLYEPRIAAIDGVESCALVGVPDEADSDERVVLAVQPKAGVDPVALRKRIEAQIRDGKGAIDPFARPDAVIFCDMPHSGRSFKLDRLRLVALAAEALARAG